MSVRSTMQHPEGDTQRELYTAARLAGAIIKSQGVRPQAAPPPQTSPHPPTWVPLRHRHARRHAHTLLARLPVGVHPSGPKVPQRVHGCLAGAGGRGAVGVLCAQDVGHLLQQLTLVGADRRMALLQHLWVKGGEGWLGRLGCFDEPYHATTHPTPASFH